MRKKTEALKKVMRIVTDTALRWRKLQLQEKPWDRAKSQSKKMKKTFSEET